jgi:hypothetical protein
MKPRERERKRKMKCTFEIDTRLAYIVAKANEQTRAAELDSPEPFQNNKKLRTIKYDK